MWPGRCRGGVAAPGTDAVTWPSPGVKGRAIEGIWLRRGALYAGGVRSAGGTGGVENWTMWSVRVSLLGVP